MSGNVGVCVRDVGVCVCDVGVCVRDVGAEQEQGCLPEREWDTLAFAPSSSHTFPNDPLPVVLCLALL